MRLFGPVDAIHELCRHEVAQVLHAVGRRVDVVVTALTVAAEAVGVLHAQVQALNITQRACFNKKAPDGGTFHRSQRTRGSVTHRVSGHEHRLADERSADLKVLQPAVDVIVSVEGARRELSWLSVIATQRNKSVHMTFSSFL